MNFVHKVKYCFVYYLIIPLRNFERKSVLEAKQIRDEFEDYFSTTDKPPFQDKYR